MITTYHWLCYEREISYDEFLMRKALPPPARQYGTARKN